MPYETCLLCWRISDCGDPGIAQSTFFGDTTYTSVIFVTCNSGYTGGTGSGSTTCLETGSWSVAITCDPVGRYTAKEPIIYLSLTHYIVGNCSCLLSSADFFLKSTF